MSELDGCDVDFGKDCLMFLHKKDMVIYYE